MPSFEAPAVDGVPSILPSTRGLQRKLFRHYRSRPEGVNVFIYSDGTVSESEPNGSTALWREADRTGDTEPTAPYVTHVFWGGHEPEEVTEAEAALLTAAGYEVIP